MRARPAQSLFGLFVVLLAAHIPAFGQLTRGYISGTLQDASGAVLAEAQIRATNTATGVEKTTVTNGAGVYRLVALEPGVYSIEFSKAGFETTRIPNISVTGNQEITINQSLNVASTVTAVEVVEAPPGVELTKSTATIERKLDQKFIENVALTGNRDVNQLALLAPTSNRAPGSTGIAANGQRARNNNFLLDGVDNNDPSVTISNNRVIPEAVSEFQVQTQAFSAEFGRNSGAQIQVITRSGTNQFHGAAYDYWRANWMEPVSLLNKRQGFTATPRYVQNQPGGLIGGPIRKNRTFFFSLVETNRRREAPSAGNASSATIPTPAGFAALSGIPLGADQTTQSRQAVLSGISFLDDIYPKVARFTNVRNVTVNGVAVQVGTMNLPLANPYDFWTTTHRIDHRLSDRDNLSYRLQLDKRTQPDVVSNLQFGSKFSGAQTILGQNHAWSYTRSVSVRFVNEFRFAYVRRVLDFPENDPKTPSSTISGFFTIGGASNFPQGRTQNTYQWQNVSTYMLGRHSLKFGGDIRRNHLLNLAAFDSKGTYAFDNLADYLNNRPASLNQAINTATFDARQFNQFYFFQDDFKASKNLTLNIGARYEYSAVPFGFFGATDAQSLGAGVPAPTKADKNNWAPRFGLAYSPTPQGGLLGKLLGDGQTVFRGGYGMAYDVLFFNILSVNGSNYPRVVVASLDRTQLVNAWPNLLPASASPVFDPYATFVNSPADTQNPTTHFYSFSIQRQFRRGYIFEAGYTGSRSYHGIRQGQGNPGILTPDQAATVARTGSASSIPGLSPSKNFPVSRRLNPAYGPRVLIESTAIGNYNAMYLKLDKRLSHGLTVGGNYTWSANLSDNDESLGVAAITNSSPQVPQNFLDYRDEYARSAFDVPHRVSVYYNYLVPWCTGGFCGNALVKHVFKGWQLTGFTDAQSGQPFTVRTGVDTYGTGSASARPILNPGGQIMMDPVTGDFRTFTTPIDGSGLFRTTLTPGKVPLANTQAFPVAAGTLGRNTYRGPGLVNWNFSVGKTIDVTERWKVMLRADWVNGFNHRNFPNPTVTMNSPIFGQNTGDPGGRTMLVSAKVHF